MHVVAKHLKRMNADGCSRLQMAEAFLQSHGASVSAPSDMWQLGTLVYEARVHSRIRQ